MNKRYPVIKLTMLRKVRNGQSADRQSYHCISFYNSVTTDSTLQSYWLSATRTTEISDSSHSSKISLCYIKEISEARLLRATIKKGSETLFYLNRNLKYGRGRIIAIFGIRASKGKLFNKVSSVSLSARMAECLERLKRNLLNVTKLERKYWSCFYLV